MTQAEIFAKVLAEAGENGMSTPELIKACKMNKQAVHGASYVHRKMKTPGFFRKGLRYYLIRQPLGTTKAALTVIGQSKKQLDEQNIVDRLSSLDDVEDKGDVLKLMKKALYYQGSAMAMLSASETIAKIGRKVS